MKSACICFHSYFDSVNASVWHSACVWTPPASDCVPPTLPGGCGWHGAPAAVVWTAGPDPRCWGHGAPWAGGRAWTSDPTAEQHLGWGWRCEGEGAERDTLFRARHLQSQFDYQVKKMAGFAWLMKIRRDPLLFNFICFILGRYRLFSQHREH